MFLANENFPYPGILFLREQGYEVISIRETIPGASDEEVLTHAKASNLIILTFDRDYGTLIFRYSAESPPAVIYFRDKGNDPSSAGEQLYSLLLKGEITFENAFTVIEKQNIRQRFYKK